ncbi:MAG: hypothetical protein B6244_02835 [Candidatus Cloacimonetes bacterium 4572_55]|nr:MAG: hypothetical protein B6244_02835 [Candidatus Cloacimonetes bacterium 4572_55]
MRFIADLHIHSHFSRATGKNLNPEQLDYRARLKGVTVVGSGDFTHPGWLSELKEKLEPAGPGLYALKSDYRQETGIPAFAASRCPVRFLLTAEISCIYKKRDKVRKAHHLLFAPDFAAAERFQSKLSRREFNIASDGRPILGMDSRDLLDMTLTISDRALFIPAHIWTPWFSVLGSKSGFDSIRECFEDLADHIYAVETGLSTDPPMHWMCSFLDPYTLISNSDAHSPEKLGRNANIFQTDLDYDAIVSAIKTGDPNRFGGTIDLFPQEGKYHYDGHRKCGICWDPVETLRHDEICPACGKPVTVGVMNRIAQLSDRPHKKERANRLPFRSIITLKDILSEILGVGPTSKRVDRAYHVLLQKLGSELSILLDISLDEIKRKGGEILAEAVTRMRERQVYVREGFDGEFGKIQVFRPGESRDKRRYNPLEFASGSLFKARAAANHPHGHETFQKRAPKRKFLNFSLDEYRRLKGGLSKLEENLEVYKTEYHPNTDQRRSIDQREGSALILAGPGTGKTYLLTRRIASLIQSGHAIPEQILAITFTNKAADALQRRLIPLLDESRPRPMVGTFHRFGLSLLRANSERAGRSKDAAVIDQGDTHWLLRYRLDKSDREATRASRWIRSTKQRLLAANQIDDPDQASLFDRYERLLAELNLYDFDDLIYHPALMLASSPELLRQYREKYQWILVDEYQDVNYAQYQLIRLLTPGENPNLTTIGDPNQAIYGFRGADPAFIHRFMTDYPEAVRYGLHQSYRCSDRILRGSRSVLQKDGGHENTQELKGMTTGPRIRMVPHKTDKSEAEFVAREIERMIGGVGFFSLDSGVSSGESEDGIESFSDFAILCRTHHQIDPVTKALRDHNIPYQAIGSDPFFRQEPIKSVIDMLRFSYDPSQKFLRDRLRQQLSPFQMERLLDMKDASLLVWIKRIIDQIFSETQAKKPIPFSNLLQLCRDYDDDDDKNISGFIDLIAFGSGVDLYQPRAERVSVMTLHASKGLEFSAVFIIGCEEGLIPYSLFKKFEKENAHKNEEQRLLYVGMTRARQFLYLSHCEKRMIHGREYHLSRSSFLDQIGENLVENRTINLPKKEQNRSKQLPLKF